MVRRVYLAESTKGFGASVCFAIKEFSLFFWACPSLRSGRATTHYASLRCYANTTHCLTACCVSLTHAAFGCFTLFDIHFQ
ncbi:MAG: hypothetical protein NZ519_11660 [Bacteroidia bacterium]|nr:hypothetical protein [Bacteroidia bacterium]